MSTLGIAAAIRTGAAQGIGRAALAHSSTTDSAINDIQSNKANLEAVPAKERQTTQIAADAWDEVQVKG